MCLLPLLPILIIISSVNAIYENIFLQPPSYGPEYIYRDNPVYMLGESIQLQWHTDMTRVDIFVSQKAPRGIEWSSPQSANVIYNTQETLISWTVSYGGFPADHNLSVTNVYYFSMRNTSDGSDITHSHYFNVTDNIPSTLSTSILTPTYSSPTPTLGHLDESEPDSSAGLLSRGAVAGVTLGSTIGGILLLGTMGYLVRRRQLSQGIASGKLNPGFPVLAGNTQEVASSMRANGIYSGPTRELSTNSPCNELP